MKLLRSWLWRLLGLFMIIAGCATENPAGLNVHSADWANPALSGNSGFHGAVVQNDGTASCTTCHGASLNGSGTAPGCGTCHFGPAGGREPANGNWTHDSNQHANQAIYSAICNQCHDTRRRFGLGPSACHDCHDAGTPTHPTGRPWLDKDEAQFHGGSSLNCTQCHSVPADCNRCHFGADGQRSPGGWSHGLNDSHRRYTDQRDVCNQCHNLNRNYGNAPSGCHDCHADATHVTGRPWLDKKNAQFHGDSSLDCASCHSVPADCNRCHFGANGQRSPGGWSHGLNDAHRNYTSRTGVCNQCHNLNRSYGNAPSGCHDCHANATHVTGRPWLDKKNGQFHGDSSLDCARCHSVPADCNRCHFGANGQRSPGGWSHGLNDAHERFSSRSSVCNQCHNLNRSFGNAPGRCHDCHGDGDDDDDDDD